MKRDDITALGIDADGRLWVRPSSETFPLIYREAMEVHWDAEGRFLYSPKPREWSYLRWFQQIVNAAAEVQCCLRLTAETQWENIPEALRSDITSWSAGACA